MRIKFVASIGNEDIFSKLMGDGEFRKLALEHLMHKVYKLLRRTDAP